MENLTEKEQIKIHEHYISELCKYAEETAAILGLDTSATILGKGCIEYWAVLSSASNNAIKKLQQENGELKEKNKVLQKLVSELEYSVQVGIELNARCCNALEEIEGIAKNFGSYAAWQEQRINKILDIISKTKGEGK